MSPELTIIATALGVLGVLTGGFVFFVQQAWGFIRERFQEKQAEAEAYKKQADTALESMSEVLNVLKEVKEGSRAQDTVLDALNRSTRGIEQILDTMLARERTGGAERSTRDAGSDGS